MGTVKGVTVITKGKRGTRTVFPQQTTGNDFAFGPTFVGNAPPPKKSNKEPVRSESRGAPMKQPAYGSRAASGGSSGKRTQFYSCAGQSVRIK